MKTEDVIINYNRQRLCKYVNVDVRFDINNYTEGANNNPHAKCVREIHITTVSNVK